MIKLTNQSYTNLNPGKMSSFNFSLGVHSCLSHFMVYLNSALFNTVYILFNLIYY